MYTLASPSIHNIIHVLCIVYGEATYQLIELMLVEFPWMVEPKLVDPSTPGFPPSVQ